MATVFKIDRKEITEQYFIDALVLMPFDPDKNAAVGAKVEGVFFKR